MEKEHANCTQLSVEDEYAQSVLTFVRKCTLLGTTLLNSNDLCTSYWANKISWSPLVAFGFRAKWPQVTTHGHITQKLAYY